MKCKQFKWNKQHETSEMGPGPEKERKANQKRGSESNRKGVPDRKKGRESFRGHYLQVVVTMSLQGEDNREYLVAPGFDSEL